LNAITAQDQLVEGAGPQYRTASTLVVDSSYPLYPGIAKISGIPGDSMVIA
jgi:hypothetical protein